MSVQQLHRSASAKASERTDAERSLEDATVVLQQRRAARRRAAESMKRRRAQDDIVDVADAAMAYQAALEQVHAFEDRLRRMQRPGP